jgi:hypothetical protein
LAKFDPELAKLVELIPEKKNSPISFVEKWRNFAREKNTGYNTSALLPRCADLTLTGNLRV